MDTFHLLHAETDAQLRACFKVMRELRPHFSNASEFVDQVRRQTSQNYRLLVAWQGNDPMALAGYRLQENLLYGRFLYVDDLIASAQVRRLGLGATLIDALRGEARAQRCVHLVLDTALGNALGQRFYYRQGLLAKGMHFNQVL